MTKNQHYVPRFYLRDFANKQDQIWVYDKFKDNLFHSNIEGVASERFFYDTERIDKNYGQAQFIEKALSVLEGQAAVVFKELLEKLNDNRFTRLHPKERSFLAEFIAIQLLRTKEYRLQIEQIINQSSAWIRSYMSEEMRTASSEQLPPAKVLDDELAEMQGRFLVNPQVILEYTKMLESHFWTVLQAVSGQIFLTSDHPVGKKANLHSHFRPMSGIASKGIEIVFPLTPNHCLCLYERTHFKNQLQVFKSSENKIHYLKNTANMDYANYFQITQSTRFLFSSQNDFSFAKKVCAEEPQWKNQSRRRVSSSHDTTIKE